MQTLHRHEVLFDKILRLPSEKIAIVDDFVEFLSHRDETFRSVKAAGKLSEQSFQKVWENQEDAEYDNL